MAIKLKLLWVCGAAVLPMAALAQFDTGGPIKSDKPWEEFKLNAKTKIKLDFHNSSVDSIITYFQKASGVSIVKDPALTGTLTLTSAGTISLKSAFAMLSKTLDLKNFEMSKEDDLLVIRMKQDRNRGGFGGFSGMGGMTGGFGDMIPSPKIKVYPIQYASASAVAKTINDVFANVQDPMTQLTQMFQGMGTANFGQNGRGGNNQFGRGGAGGASPFANRGGAGGFGGFGGFGQRGGAGAISQAVKASADDFSNSVIVNAADKDQADVNSLIKSIDKQTTSPQVTEVHKLEYAAAQDLVTVVQNVLNANVPTGRGGLGAQAQNQNPFANLIRTATTGQSGGGQVVAETRTNSLVVTSTKENLEIVSRTIKELDKEVKVESTTFVFPLANAKADVVAALLQQAFGQRQGVNNTGAGRVGTTTGTTTNRTNNNNNGRNTGAGGGLGLAPTTEMIAKANDSRSLPIDLQDPNALSGELMTSIAAQGFGGFGGQGGGGGGLGGLLRGGQTGTSTTTPTQGRDAQGRLINTKDLTGTVTAIPDTNTNSIIIVASPDSAQIIRGILDQLDKIPEQVMIETIIVEATLDKTDTLGVEWKYLQQKAFGVNGSTGTVNQTFGNQTNTTNPPSGLVYTLTGGNLSTFINAIKTDQKFQVLSTPRIFTSNNVQAQINISQSIPYILSSRQDVNGNYTYNYAFQDVGIVLTVTPRITSNGYVTLDVTQTANDLQGYTSFNAPIVNQRQAETTVNVKDTETVILGGIIRKTVTANTNKVPLLGDIPILGNLFKSTSNESHRTELLVLLTPRIVRNAEDAKKLRQDTQVELSKGNQDAIKNLIKPESAPDKGKKTGGN